ncbi:methyltransferase [beta proteobacterium AAP121]|nr:methyltransferase [beta proteobacterium AAP65]KPF97027.1 methyltransferase [beta proteobacterium AAP121]
MEDALAQGQLHKLVLAQPEGVQPEDLQRITARPLLLRGEACLSLVYSHRTRDVTKNLPLSEALALLPTLAGKPGFRKLHLLAAGGESQLAISKRGKALFSHTASATPADAPPPAEAAGHDREKQRWIALQAPFLGALGVTTPQGTLVPAMARKWKQINKFVEVFAHALQRSPLAGAKHVKVADFGAGRGYLTFAIHHWLQHGLGVQAEVHGVELRPDLVAEAQASIARLGLQGLRFEAGDVRDFQPGAMNVMIALHACDTATDHAIHLGLQAGAEIILCSPCCHKQIRPQLLSPHPLRPVFQHGIHAEQQAEMLTDSLRALLLEARGYDTQVFEFITLEHTRKNKMILAVKREDNAASARQREAALAQVTELKRFFGIREQALETLLQAEA